MLTQDRIRELLDYNSASGVFTWKTRRSNGAAIFSVAGWLHKQGYVAICVDRKNYLAHRLAWLYVHGEMPKEMDHINRNKIDNRIINLRPVTRSENRANGPLQKNNKSGLRGVSWDKQNQKWVATITWNRHHYTLGRFINKEDAHEAYLAKARELHGDFKTYENMT